MQYKAHIEDGEDLPARVSLLSRVWFGQVLFREWQARVRVGVVLRRSMPVNRHGKYRLGHYEHRIVVHTCYVILVVCLNIYTYLTWEASCHAYGH